MAGTGQVGNSLSGTVLRQRLHGAIPISRTTLPVPDHICLPAAVSPLAVPSGSTPFVESRSAPLPAAVPAARRGGEGRRAGRAAPSCLRGGASNTVRCRRAVPAGRVQPSSAMRR